ncbi:MAG: hypothetical protein P8099_18630 [Gemmatimonadota bacterium]
MLRGVLLGIGVAGLLVAVGYLAVGLYEPGLQLLVIFAVLTAGIAFQRWRYVRNVNRGHGRWQATGERFVDPTTNELTDVYYNPDTGERDYRIAEKRKGRGSSA